MLKRIIMKIPIVLKRKVMHVCYAILSEDMGQFIQCMTYTEEYFKDIEEGYFGSWTFIYRNNKGRIETDFVIFALVIVLGIAD